MASGRRERTTATRRCLGSGASSISRRKLLVPVVVVCSLISLALHYAMRTDKSKLFQQRKVAIEMDVLAQKEPVDPYPYDLNPLAEDEAGDFTEWAPLGGGRYSEYRAGGTPWIVTADAKLRSDDRARSRRSVVRDAMKFAWSGYVNYAFGYDELKPVTGRGDNVWGGIGTTLVDSLDTLWLMDMKEEFWQARDWVATNLKHDHVGTVSVFETTIRSLGGLLSAYDWSHDEVFLTKAQDLGDRLMKAFDGSKSGIPFTKVDLSTGKTSSLSWTAGNVIIAEGTTLQIEFRYLAKMTGEKEYAQRTEQVFETYNKIAPKNGLYPHLIDGSVDPPRFASSFYSFGAMEDSFYEYMLKIWLQGGRKEPMYRAMYDKAIQGMHDELVQVSTPSGLTYLADKNRGRLEHHQHHLTCFMGGLLALGAYTDPLGLHSERAERDLKTAKALTYTCYQMYARMKTGISPESVRFRLGNDMTIDLLSRRNVLRPEVFESFFVLNYLTGDPVYREWGWECFSAIQRYCKTAIAYGQFPDVSKPKRLPEDKMESFFLAESLKYLYLLQNPDTEVDILNKHVFNTEAHPMRMFQLIDIEHGQNESGGNEAESPNAESDSVP